MTNAVSIFGTRRVELTHEVQRIQALPRRQWSEADALDLAERLTRELRTKNGTMSLRPIQAIALWEMMENGGLFAPIRVGGGKSLLSLLAPVVLEAKRPALLIPASLIEKTNQERMELSKHWQLSTNLHVISYEMMGRVSCADKLTYIKPDLLILDECHRIKNHRAGVTRRIKRYMQESPTTKFVGMSGTIMKSSLRDFAHILRWCLKDKSPIPKTEDETAIWADAIDEKVNPVSRVQAGALLKLGPPQENATQLEAARRSFRDRLLDTPGVVASSSNDGVDCSLNIGCVEYDVNAITEEQFKSIRNTWTTVDGWTFSEAVELWKHCRSIALGFTGVWDPRPPPEWLAARKEWAGFVRKILSSSRTLDTELQVVHAVDAGTLPSNVLKAWRDIRDTFTVNPKPVWHDDSALKVCEKWLKNNTGICWVDHVFFGEELAKRSGLSYYGADGLDSKGRSIVGISGKESIIASIKANSTGRNLQCFHNNLVTAPPPGSSGFEQLIGRTHREGQQADEVNVDILMGCREHHDAIWRAIAGAEAASDILGHDQKLLLATKTIPTNLIGRIGARWELSANK